MSPPEAIISCFRNYFNFKGRALRSEYWYFFLFVFIFGIFFNIVDMYILSGKINLDQSQIGIFEAVFSILVFIPHLAVSVRRLHDINRSGWWLLISFTIIGLIPLLYWDCKRGDMEANKYGISPLSLRSPSV